MSRLTVGIDTHRLIGAQGGVGRYLRELLWAWARRPLPFARVRLYCPRPLPEGTLPEGHPYDVRVTRGTGPIGVWQHTSLARAARADSVLFCPSYVAPLTFRGKFVVTVHDAIHEVMPEAFPRRDRYRALLYRHSARRAALVVTPSEAARRDLIHHYGLPATRVRAIPLGADALPVGTDDACVRASLGLAATPFVLFVGKFTRRRRLMELVEMTAKLEAAGRPHALVLVGDDPHGFPLAERARELGIADRVRILGPLDDHEVAALYRAADVFIYPSEYEGFGLPVVEAMAAGTPVVTLDNTSLVEIAGGAAVLLPDANPLKMAAAVEDVLDDTTLRADLIARGRRRARGYTWSATADATLAALQDAAEGP